MQKDKDRKDKKAKKKKKKDKKKNKGTVTNITSRRKLPVQFLAFRIEISDLSGRSL